MIAAECWETEAKATKAEGRNLKKILIAPTRIMCPLAYIRLQPDILSCDNLPT